MTEAKISDTTLAEKSSRNDIANDTFIIDDTSEAARKQGVTDVEKKAEREEDESQYPSTKIVAIVMLALYLAMYLVALVRGSCYQENRIFPDRCSRTEPSSQQLSPPSQTSSILLGMSAGTDLRIWSRHVACNSNSDASSPSTIPSTSFWPPLVPSKLVLPSAVPHPTPPLLSSDARLLGQVMPGCSPE